jgi:hypothetical protein
MHIFVKIKIYSVYKKSVKISAIFQSEDKSCKLNVAFYQKGSFPNNDNTN